MRRLPIQIRTNEARELSDRSCRWLVPDISPENLDRTVWVVRKGMHVVGFGILAALCWRGLAAGAPGWDKRRAAVAILGTACYAMTDEWHQSHVSNRVGSMADVGFDTAGAAAAVGLIWLFGRRHGRW